MNTLVLSEYIDYIKKHSKPSPRTVARYEDTLRVMGPEFATVDIDSQPALYKRLLEILPTRGYGYITTYLTIFNALMNLDGHPIMRERQYHTLQAEIEKLRGRPRSYTDQEINLIFAAVASSHSPYQSDLHKLLVLMLYSGLRIGACQNIAYDSIQKVENHDVYTFPVHSKGIDYNAFISKTAYRFLEINKRGPYVVTDHSAYMGYSFDKLYRQSLNRIILTRGLMTIRENTSIFHSFRKSYAEKLLSTGTDPKNFYYAYLMGHVQRVKTATKYYIMPDGKRVPLELLDSCAGLYEKSPLQTMGIGITEPEPVQVQKPKAIVNISSDDDIPTLAAATSAPAAPFSEILEAP